MGATVVVVEEVVDVVVVGAAVNGGDSVLAPETGTGVVVGAGVVVANATESVGDVNFIAVMGMLSSPTKTQP